MGVLPLLQSLLGTRDSIIMTFSLHPLLLILVTVYLAGADVNTMTDKIMKDILKDYNPDSRPAGNKTDRNSCTN